MPKVSTKLALCGYTNAVGELTLSSVLIHYDINFILRSNRTLGVF